jgi:D-tagatose-1,6-bisphosphate aldolase subunit GatZ/KbaZ
MWGILIPENEVRFLIRPLMPSFLQELPHLRTLNQGRGIYSVCSSHPLVLEAGMRRHSAANGPLLIEATCNQVNQFGGYTGLTPGDFRAQVQSIAEQVGFPTDRILLGGDHLGPYPWRNLPASQAMTNAREMVRAFAGAGYEKLHLDASMPCADDPSPLPDHVIAQRAADLCRVAEGANLGGEPVYVVGTEVPTPGGAVEGMKLSATSPEAAEEALRSHRQEFLKSGLGRAWQRVVALVVQPGVEFSDESVEDYDSARAAPLSAWLRQNSGFVFEAHSTDYQRREALAALVRDGFAILKVGPALTYAMRQALFALARIEVECIQPSKRSQLRECMEEIMLRHREHWDNYYRGTPEEQHRLRTSSYSDRIRYYWGYPEAKNAVQILISNLEHSGIPETLVSDYLPTQYIKIREGSLRNEPLSLILDAIGNSLEPYLSACGA